LTRREIGYWTATGLFCLAFTAGGTGHLLRADPMREGMLKLGYPLYVMTILGSAKLLGVVALLVPGRPLLKEWAYAGFSFNLLGAVASHIFVGDPLGETLPPAILLCVAAASYRLRPPSRRLSLSNAGFQRAEVAA
jgi:hypothetical protein